MAELQGRKSRLVNIVGVNAPPLSVQGIERSDVPQAQDTSAQNFEQTRQNIDDIYASQLKMQEEYAKQRTAAASMRGKGRASSELAGVAEAVLGAAATFKAMEDAKKKADKEQADEAAKLLQQQRTMLARTAVQDATLAMQDLIVQQGRDEGINSTELRVNELLDVEFADLPPETRSALRDITFTQINQEKEKSADRQLTAATELRQSQVANQRTTIQAQSASLLANIQYSSSPQEASQQFQATISYIATATQGLSDQERLDIVNPLMEEAYKRLQSRGDAYAQVGVQMQATQQFYQALPGLREQYGSNPDAWASQTQLLAQSLGVPELANGALDNLQLMQRTNQYNETEQSLLEHANTVEGRELDQRFPGYLAAQSALEAFKFINDPNSSVTVNRILSNTAAYSPILVGAAQQAQEFQKARERNRTLASDMRSQLERVASLTRRATPEEVSNVRTVLARDYLGNATGEVIVINVPNAGLVVPRPEISQEELRLAITTASMAEAEVTNLNREWAARGFNLNQPADDSLMNIHRITVDTFAANQRQVEANRANATPIQQNFNQGATQGTTSAPGVQPLLRQSGRVLPFRPGSEVTVTSPYGERHMNGRNFHSGVDFAFTGQTRSRRVGIGTVSAGRVLHAGAAGGYHTMVQVQTADGHIEEYGHLWGVDVREGDTVAEGQQIGWLPPSNQWHTRPGDDSTGNHLHFTVRQPGHRAPNGGNTIEPLEYLEQVAGRPPARNSTPGLGAPPNQLYGGRPSSATMMPGGQQYVAEQSGSRYVVDPATGFYMRAANVITPAAPTRTVRAPIQRNAYPQTSNPTANYGYGQLRDNPALARAFAEVANDLGFPAQWLVDIAAHESNNFNPQARNSRTRATGIIQFMPETAAGLNNGRGYTIEQIARMDVVEQLRRPTREYLSEWRGRINTVEDLLVAIWGGAGGYNRSVADRRSMNDHTMFTDNNGVRRLFRLPDYLDRLGRGAGRSYQHSYRPASSTHTSPVRGCSICNQQLASGAGISPHTAP